MPNGTRVHLSNTCTVDNIFTFFSLLKNTLPHLWNELVFSGHGAYDKLMNLIEVGLKGNWSQAKVVWATEVMKIQPDDNNLNFYGTEYSTVLKFILQRQEYESVATCSLCGHRNKRPRALSSILVK